MAHERRTLRARGPGALWRLSPVKATQLASPSLAPPLGAHMPSTRLPPSPRRLTLGERVGGVVQMLTAVSKTVSASTSVFLLNGHGAGRRSFESTPLHASAEGPPP